MAQGGADSIPDNLVQAVPDGTKAKAPGALDAVQETTMTLEDDANAGTGSVSTSNGDIQMDAVPTDGNTLNSGGEKTDHNQPVGPGANQLAEEVGTERVPQDPLELPKAKLELERLKVYGSIVNQLFRS